MDSAQDNLVVVKSVPNTYPENFFEKKFLSVIDAIGTYKIKSAKSYLLYTYFKIKLSCKTNRFTYDTIVIGDESDDEAEARESVFRKAYNVVQYKFKQDLEEFAKSKRKRDLSQSY